MNIFVLSLDPVQAAQMQCDKHVPKMLLESTQLLCNAIDHGMDQLPSALSLREGKGVYKKAHLGHPCSKWTLESRHNWLWLLAHAFALLEEYKFRFQNKSHKCEEMLLWLSDHKEGITLEMPDTAGMTPFALAVGDEYKTRLTAVLAYRDFYRATKARFAKWQKGRPAPEWL